jgi:hypothetical protein
MKVLSTLGFDAQIQTADGSRSTLPKSILAVAPTVTNGIAANLPEPAAGVLWLVNGVVFAATDRPDFVMFSPALTVRDSEGKAVAQGGYIDRAGTSHQF